MNDQSPADALDLLPETVRHHPSVIPSAIIKRLLEQGIEMSTHDMDTDPFREAAARAKPIWPPN